MIIFNYIYYLITRYYKQFKEGSEYFLVGIVVVSILQFLNLFVVLSYLSQYIEVIENVFYNLKYENNKNIFFLIITILLILNYFYYNNYISYEQLSLKWKLKLSNVYKRYNIYILIYIIVSILLVVLSIKYILVKI